MKLSAAEIADLVARGATIGPSVQLPREEPQAEETPANLIGPSVGVTCGRVTINVAFASKSEVNLRLWKGRSRRSGEAWKAVRNAVGPHLGFLEPFARFYAYGSALRVTFTRLGGRTMDRSNLPAAMKGCEDAIAYLLGADDGSPQWHSFFEQEPGGLTGVRITVEVYA